MFFIAEHILEQNNNRYHLGLALNIEFVPVLLYDSRQYGRILSTKDYHLIKKPSAKYGRERNRF